jgi:GNAT superfamily N-acetyltransferase
VRPNEEAGVIRPTKNSDVLFPLGLIFGIENMARDDTDICGSLLGLESVYPGFRSWFEGKVVPGLYRGTRRLFTVMNAGRPIGIAIAKREEERKLCTVWVHEEYRREGVAWALVERAIEWLGTERPLFTVPEERLSEFQGILRRRCFEHAESAMAYYRPGKVEHVFNGHLGRTTNS